MFNRRRAGANFHSSWLYNLKICFRVLMIRVVVKKQENVHQQIRNSKTRLAQERKVIKTNRTKKVIKTIITSMRQQMMKQKSLKSSFYPIINVKILMESGMNHLGRIFHTVSILHSNRMASVYCTFRCNIAKVNHFSILQKNILIKSKKQQSGKYLDKFQKHQHICIKEESFIETSNHITYFWTRIRM